MNFKVFDTLPDSARKIREDVFVKEQGFSEEFDQQDLNSFHMVLYNDENQAIGCCRFFPEAQNSGVWIIGRIAVIKDCRKQHLGSKIVVECIKELKSKNAKKVKLHAQLRAKGFYESLGFKECSKVDEDEGVPHIWMMKDLQQA